MKSHKIGVVGPCAAGKSTLVTRLMQNGYIARHIAQEHSYVANMWKRLTNPDVLIYLHVSYLLSMKRRNMNWTESEYAEELRRLAHAREHADLVVDTDSYTAEEVYQLVVHFLETRSGK